MGGREGGREEGKEGRKKTEMKGGAPFTKRIRADVCSIIAPTCRPGGPSRPRRPFSPDSPTGPTSPRIPLEPGGPGRPYSTCAYGHCNSYQYAGIHTHTHTHTRARAHTHTHTHTHTTAPLFPLGPKAPGRPSGPCMCTNTQSNQHHHGNMSALVSELTNGPG